MADVTMWLMNTGYVGGDSRDVKAGKALKVKIPHSSAMLEALLSEKIEWTTDPDFGYEVVDVEATANADLVEKVGAEILQPRRYFERAGRMDEYRAWVDQMKTARRDFLKKYDVPEPIVQATCG